METTSLLIAAPAGTQVVEFAPAHTMLIGDTAAERRLNVVMGASFAVQAYLSAEKGKVGQAARNGMATAGILMIAKQARCGNYKPLTEALAVKLGASVYFSTRAAYESYLDVLQAKLADLKGGGFRIGRDGVETPTAARQAILNAIDLYHTVQDAIQNVGGSDESSAQD